MAMLDIGSPSSSRVDSNVPTSSGRRHAQPRPSYGISDLTSHGELFTGLSAMPASNGGGVGLKVAARARSVGVPGPADYGVRIVALGGGDAHAGSGAGAG